MTEAVQRGASAEAIRHHYDVANEFYALWLDSTKTYSCAFWDGDPDESLDSAQLRKLDYMLGECISKPGAALLDVGCGWGSALTRALDSHHASTVTGLTLSLEQATHLRSRNDERLNVLVEDWADFRSDETFDAIVSIGALEHFVKFGWGREDRVAAYRRFFETCHGLLKPGGKLALQAIGKGNTPLDEPGLADVLFIVQHIFPESDLPKLSEITQACERYFETVQVRNDRLHYARTCADWLTRLRSRREEAVALVGQDKYEQFERYLAASVRQFELGHANLYRLTLQRADR